tara:strand:- start:215 stop:466 length:252 start_codon:yes stop_codon:yes gene_type:complete
MLEVWTPPSLVIGQILDRFWIPNLGKNLLTGSEDFFQDLVKSKISESQNFKFWRFNIFSIFEQKITKIELSRFLQESRRYLAF